MTEKQIERKLVEGVKRIGGIAYKFVSPGNAGVPDRIVVLPGGKVIFVELKTETGRLSEIQKRQIARLKERGCDVIELHGIKDTEEFLEYCGLIVGLLKCMRGAVEKSNLFCERSYAKGGDA